MRKIMIIIVFLFLLTSCRNEKIDRIEAEILEPIIIERYDEFSPENIKVYGYFNSFDRIDITDKVTYIVETDFLGVNLGEIVYGPLKTDFEYTVIERKPEPIVYTYTMLITTQGVKTSYCVNEMLDLSNIIITIRDNFDNKISPDVDDCKVSIFYESKEVDDLSNVGLHELYFSYFINEIEVKEKININVYEMVTEKYSINIDSFKTDYLVNENVEIENIFIEKLGGNDFSQVIDTIYSFNWRLEFNGVAVESLFTSGKFELIIETDYFYEALFINVYDSIDKSLSVDISNAKLRYYINESYDSNGLIVKYDGKIININECQIFIMYENEVYDQFENVGFYNVVIEYLDSEFTYDILVVDKNIKDIYITPNINFISNRTAKIEIPNNYDSLYECNIFIYHEDVVIHSFYFLEECVNSNFDFYEHVINGSYSAFIDGELYNFIIEDFHFNLQR